MDSPIFQSQVWKVFLLAFSSFQIPKCCSTTRNLLWGRPPLHRGPLCSKDFTSWQSQWEWGNLLGKFFCWHNNVKHHKCNQCGNKFEYHQWAGQSGLFSQNLWHLPILCTVWDPSERHLSTVTPINVGCCSAQIHWFVRWSEGAYITLVIPYLRFYKFA